MSAALRRYRYMGALVRALSVLALGMLVSGLSACSPTNGEDGSFQQQATTATTFTLPQTEVTVGNQPISLDFTTSGSVLDLIAVVNHVADAPLNPDGSFNEAGSVSILRNNPPGTIAEVTPAFKIDTLQFPTQALWATVDPPDGNPDLIILDDNNEHIAIHLATGFGTFNNTPTQEFTFTHAISQLKVVDLDNDGADDIVLTIGAEDNIVALLNDGAGLFTQVDTTAVVGLGRFVAANLDGDGSGFIDLALLRVSDSRIYLWRGVGDGTFDQTMPDTQLNAYEGTLDIVGGDFTDGTGKVSLAIVGDSGNKDQNLVRLFVNTFGDGDFTAAAGVQVPAMSYRLFALDTLTAVQNVGVIHRNDRHITFLGATGTNFNSTVLTTTRDPVEVTAGDLDGDLNVDLITAEDDRRTIGVFLSDGAGGFTRTQIGLTTHVAFPRLVDVDNDGVLDLIVVEPFSDALGVFINTN